MLVILPLSPGKHNLEGYRRDPFPRQHIRETDDGKKGQTQQDSTS